MDYSDEEKWDIWSRKAHRSEFEDPEKIDFQDDYVDWAIGRWMDGIISLSDIPSVHAVPIKKMAKGEKKDQLFIKKDIAKAGPSESQKKRKANG